MGDEVEEATSTSLLIQACGNLPNAWERIVQLYGPLVYRWCRQKGLQPTDADAIGQEVFLSVADHLPEFRRDKVGDSFRAWLRVITRNKITDFFRNSANETALGGESGQLLLASMAAPDDEDSIDAVSQEARILSEQAISIVKMEFSDRDWQIFYRFVGAEESAISIADDFGVTVNTVYLVKSRIRKRLRDYFAGLIEESCLP